MRIDRPQESAPAYLPPETAGEGGRLALVPRTQAPAPFVKTLTNIGRALDQGEALAQSAARGGAELSSLTPATLLALQSGIYRYTEIVDLASKLVDRATTAVKTTLQNQ